MNKLFNNLDMEIIEKFEIIFDRATSESMAKKNALDYYLMLIEDDAEAGIEIEEVVNDAMFKAFSENPDSPKLQVVHLLNAIKETVPLSRTMRDQIDFLRKWSSSRAKQAGLINTENLNDSKEIPLTIAEKELNRKFD